MFTIVAAALVDEGRRVLQDTGRRKRKIKALWISEIN